MKVDLKKSLDSYRAKANVFRVVDVPEAQYLAIDGHGAPLNPEFATAIGALYPVAYAMKFASKNDLDRDYVVMPLEGLWWADDMSSFTTNRDKSQWEWTLLIMVPDWTTREMFDAAIAKIARKKDRPAKLDEVRLETFAESRCVQTLHVGSFDDEASVLAEMHDRFIPEHGFAMTGKHHEIYLSDFRRVEPAKLRTILRQPVRNA
ncbi:GyrI-like domain-containing protein [Microbacterium sp. NPDC076911]|uniref:GyrI-like domain-containing protein n=1 Tax=Microbacterium sp. NPDC076911 TaxID=3154958 RepID=UPI00341FD546